MKKPLLALAVASALLCSTAAQSAIVLSFSPSSQSIGIGGTASVDVSISGLGSEILSAFDINFVWNSAVLSPATVDFTPACTALGAGAVCIKDTDTPGNIGLGYYSLLDDATLAGGQADSLLLGTLTLTGAADGVTYLTLGADLDFDRNLVGLDFQSLSVNVGSACIAVGTGACNVPEPASYALVMLALAGAMAPAALRRRRTPAV